MRHSADREFEVPRGQGAVAECVARAEIRARAARADFIARLPVGTGPLGLTRGHLRADPTLAAAREVWRVADRDAVSARDDAAAFAGDIPPAGEDPE